MQTGGEFVSLLQLIIAIVINLVSNHDSCSRLIAEELRCRPECTKVTNGKWGTVSYTSSCYESTASYLIGNVCGGGEDCTLLPLQFLSGL